LEAPAGVLAYERRAGDDRRRVWANFGDEPATCAGGWTVEVATQRSGEGGPWDGHLGGGEAVVVRPQG
ncbi:MAG: alpha-glucosidase C-terminal domain-containing protein, partial [Actinomycetota bacterium]|nr:alpha-glucosidase C-terminal domain-containing protein [Actinomycetota bacterium]